MRGRVSPSTKNEVTRTDTGSFSPREKRFVNKGNDNGPGSLSPSKYRICHKGNDINPTLDTSSLEEYKELQSQLDDMEGEDDPSKGLYNLLKKDTEASLEPTDFCLFEQFPHLWRFIKRGKNVGFQILGRRPKLSGMDKRNKEIMAFPTKDRMDWKAPLLDQCDRKMKIISIEQRSRTDSEDILQYKLPAWFDPRFDTEIHRYTELTRGAPTYFRQFMEQEYSSEPDKLEPITPWFDADSLNNIHTERSSTGDPSTPLHLPKLPFVDPIISEKSQPLQVWSINSIPDRVPTVNVPELVERRNAVQQKEPTSTQPMTGDIREDIELNGAAVGETAPPQPPERTFFDRSMRLEDFNPLAQL
ncbi:hypothetical protein P9112_004018 [Eukaryota sp. TZLM1-RC]